MSRPQAPSRTAPHHSPAEAEPGWPSLNILVALDGSELSREAFEYAALLAEAGGFPLQAIHVAEGGMDGGEPDDGFMNVSEAIRSCKSYCSFRRLPLDVSIVEGKLTDTLAARGGPSTLIVVGLKGRFARAGLGSTTRWLITHAQGPVMIVGGPSQRQLGRVVAVHDGSPACERVAGFARGLAECCAWPLTVLAVPGHGRSLEESLEGAATQALDATVVAQAAPGRGAADPVEGAVAEYRHALVVMAGYNDSWIRQLAGGGTTGHLLKNLHAPIILVP